MPKTYDPLACIPSAEAVRRRLSETRELARRLGVLLKTAEELERDTGAEPSADQQEAPHASK